MHDFIFSRTRLHILPLVLICIILCLGHILAFDYFGGVPEEILYDQNRCVVLKPGIKDVTINNRLLDFALIITLQSWLCRPYRPETKGKVENTVKFVKQNFLTIQDTNNIFVLNQRKKEWLNEDQPESSFNHSGDPL